MLSQQQNNVEDLSRLIPKFTCYEVVSTVAYRELDMCRVRLDQVIALQVNRHTFPCFEWDGHGGLLVGADGVVLVHAHEIGTDLEDDREVFLPGEVQFQLD